MPKSVKIEANRIQLTTGGGHENTEDEELQVRGCRLELRLWDHMTT